MTESMFEDSQQAWGLADAASATLVLHGRARHSDRVRPSRTLNLAKFLGGFLSYGMHRRVRQQSVSFGQKRPIAPVAVSMD